MAEPIRNKRDMTAPTPQNTPAANSGLAQHARSGQQQISSMASISEQAASGLSALANNPAMLALIEGKLDTLTGNSSGYVESLPKAVKDRVASLKALRLKDAAINAEFQREVLELEKKFHARHEVHFTRRAKIIAGEVQPTEEEIKIGREELEAEARDLDQPGYNYDDAEETADAAGSSADAEVVGIPAFWLTALRNLPAVGDTIQDYDVEILTALTDIRLRYIEEPGFALDFEFGDQSAFTNKVLTKTYFYDPESLLMGDFSYDHAEGTDIKWTSPEANVTVNVESRKQRNKHTGATRTIERVVPVESFFNFFSPPEIPEDEEDEYSEDLHDRLEMDFEMGEIIKDKLLPAAIDWFTGKALLYEEDIEGEDDDDHFDDELSGSEGDEEEDSNEEAEGGAAKKESPPECKQQ